MSEMKKIYITGLWILCLTSGVSAQTYDIIERRNSWNAGTNVTGRINGTTNGITIKTLDAPIAIN